MCDSGQVFSVSMSWYSVPRGGGGEKSQEEKRRKKGRSLLVFLLFS